jgi:hypothetical protein
VAPFVLAKWNQTTVNGQACFNYYTPTGSSGSVNNYPCGCVATAMAEIMRYFQWPTSSVGTTAYTVTIDGKSAANRLRGGDGKGGAYAWSNMPLDPNGATLTQRQAIGALCYDAATAAHMDYSNESSGASLSDAATALSSAFHFSNAVWATSIGSGAMVGMINANLDARTPVMLGIQGTDAGTHAVVCDGYGYSSSAMYYHINMGWSGSYDAWYNLPTIDAGDYVFTSLLDVIYNAFPTNTGEIISGRVVDSLGTAISGAKVLATNTQGAIYSVTTDANGIYAIRGARSKSTYKMGVTKSGYAATNSTCSTSTSSSGTSTSGNVWGKNFSLSVLGPPSIVTQPQNVTVTEGGQATWTIGALGQGPLVYRWVRNGKTISGATNATLTLSNLQLSDSGSTFYCVVNNSGGSITSATATLTVHALVVDHFEFGEIASPETTGKPFSVTATAYDASENVVSNYSGSVSLQAWSPIYESDYSQGFENGYDGWTDEGGAYALQFTNDTVAVGNSSLTMIGGAYDGYDGAQYAFAQSIRPSRVSFYVRAAQTNQAVGYVVAGMSKFRTNSVFHFRMDSTGTMGLTDGSIDWRAVPYTSNQWYKISLNIDWTARTVDYYVNEALAASGVSFCAANVTNMSVVNLFNFGGISDAQCQVWWDEIEFLTQTGTNQVAITPATLGTFTKGSWTGAVTVQNNATNLLLVAKDTAGHAGKSNPFTVQDTTPSAPVFQIQPQDVRVPVGGNAAFNVSVSGAQPLVLTWFRDGVEIPDAHATNYVVSGVALSDSKSQFSCLASNALGLVYSSSAKLTVTLGNPIKVAIVSSDLPEADADVKAKLMATGFFDSTNVTVFRAGDATPTLNDLKGYDATLVYCYSNFISTTALGNALASYAEAGGGIVVASDALCSVSRYGLAGRLATNGWLPYIPGMWEPTNGQSTPDMTLLADIADHPILNGILSLNNGDDGYRDAIQLADGATQIAHWDNLEPLVCVRETNGTRLVALNFYPPSSDAIIGAWDSTTDGAQLMANALYWAARNADRLAPAITEQPQSQTIQEGATVQFTIASDGVEPLTFQWRKNGAKLSDDGHFSGTESQTLTILDATSSDAAYYSVVVSNTLGSATSSSAKLTVLTAPHILGWTSDITAAAGKSLSISVFAIGSSPMTYRWYKDDVLVTNRSPLSGATTATLTFSSANPSNSGTYIAVVSNAVNVEKSSPITVLILAKPAITNQPVATTVAVGTPTSLSVGAAGTNLVYQWKRGAINLVDGNGLSGAQTPVLSFAAAAISNSGNYSVVISNVAGSVTSKTAKLAVLSPPKLTNAPADQTVLYGSNATFQVNASGSAKLSYQWVKDGAVLADKKGKITGSRTAKLVIAKAKETDAGFYSVTITNAVGSVTSDSARLQIGPGVRIASPANKAIVTNASITVKGTASDAGGPGLSRIMVQLNSGGFQDAEGLTNWTAVLNPIPGTNLLEAKSMDAIGLESPLASLQFVYNPYAALAGVYNGLMGADASEPDRAGFLTLTLQSSRTFTAAFTRSGVKKSFTGKFDWNGSALVVLSNFPSVAIELTLPVAGETTGLTGSYITTDWTSAITCVKAAPQVKATYALALDNNAPNESGPQGDGIGTVLVAATGQATFTGWLPDNTPFSSPQGAFLSANGLLPFYASLNSGKGALIGWLNIDTNTTTLSGALNWIKTTAAGTNYLNGITNALQAEGSALVSRRLLAITNGLVTLTGGGLETPLTNQILLNAANAITVVTGQNNSLKLKITPVSGQISGSFIHPATLQKRTIRGAVLPQQNESRGHFIGPQSGWFQLQPADN